MEKIEIKPGVAILSMLKHLNYKPYYALAEFVDNAIDSFQKNESVLKELHGDDFKLEVSIELDRTANKITIRDNAAGIDAENYKRAFRPAAVPPDNTKLSEFGMGMKSASCWFANKWNVKSSAIGEAIEKTVNFDIIKIVDDTTEELEVMQSSKNKDSHYTVVTLLDVEKKMPSGRGLSKVKKHLASIYRDFLREGFLVLKLNNEELFYETPKILRAKIYDQADNENAEILEWKKEITFDFGGSFRASGFVALMEKSSRSASGFALFRRGRVIEGSADTDEGFRPEEIFKQLGSPTYIRLFGELHLDGFEVSHTKDGFQWDDNLETFLDLLKEELSKKELPMLKQADKYRARESKINLEKVAKDAVDDTIKTINSAELSDDVNAITISDKKTDTVLQEIQESYSREFPLEFNGIDWNILIELSYNDSINDLIEMGEHLLPQASKNRNNIGIRLSLLHPFMVSFIGADKNKLEPFVRFVAALCLSEFALGQLYEDTNMEEIRYGINKLLKGALSKQA